MMESKDTLLMIIDVQEKLVQSIKNKQDILFNIKQLIDAANLLSVSKFFSEQNPSKLGPTVSLLSKSAKDIMASKMSFSCIKCGELQRILLDRNIRNLLLCGIETHVCVQQTALDFLNQGFNVHIAIDGVGSRNDLDHQTALKRIESAGGIITTTESIIFEWCRNADRKEFRRISEIIKRPKPDSLKK